MEGYMVCLIGNDVLAKANPNALKIYFHLFSLLWSKTIGAIEKAQKAVDL